MQTKKSTFFFVNVIIITILSCVANLAFAQENSGTTTLASSTLATPTEEERTPRRMSAPERELPLQMQVRVTNLVANMSNRIDAAQERLTTITKRAQSRSQKLALQSYDTTSVDLYLEEATIQLEAVQTSMSIIDTQVTDAITSQTPREAWASIKDVFIENVQHLQNAKTALRNALLEMKLIITENRLQVTGNASGTEAQSVETTEELSQ